MSEHPLPGDGYWYLGGPYSDNPVKRYLEHLDTAHFLTKANLTVYSPIVHFHSMATRHALPIDSKYWEPHNYNMLLHSNGMIVLQLPNWRESEGLKSEILFCQMKNKRVWGLTLPTDMVFAWTRLY